MITINYKGAKIESEGFKESNVASDLTSFYGKFIVRRGKAASYLIFKAPHLDALKCRLSGDNLEDMAIETIKLLIDRSSLEPGEHKFVLNGSFFDQES